METKKDPLKLFVSYSHEDEGHLNNLRKHLNILKKEGIVDHWDDRKLIAGQKLDDEILSHLKEADLIVFLVSIDFLTSYYCYDIELAAAFEQVKNAQSRIISIIVRHCDWSKSGLQKYVAIPKDAIPISEHDDHDKAWLQVSKEIEKAAKDWTTIKSNKPLNLEIVAKNKAELTDTFKKKLNDTEVIFQHKQKDFIFLEDIFVFPDLKNLKRDKIELQIGRSDALIPFKAEDSKLLILGSEQIGKTSLAKMYFQRANTNDYLPILINGNEIKNTDFTELLEKTIGEQYKNLNLEEFLSFDNKVLIIDDFDKSKLNVRYKKKYIETILGLFKNIILFSDNILKFDESIRADLSGFSQYEIMPLGHELRNDLIDKWNSIGQAETIDLNTLYAQNDNFTHHINSILRKNILPPKPIYILTIIQMLDTATPTDYSLTSYGHCYQALIQKALQKVKISIKDFDSYINYLSELAYFIFKTGKNKIDLSELTIFQEKYSKQYLVRSHEHIINVLLEAGILKRTVNEIYFSYRYIFYFYVAKYVADHLSICKTDYEYLCQRMHTEKNANILIFLIHHTKDQSVLDEIYLHASLVFDGVSEAKLDVEDTKHLEQMMEAIPKLVMEQKNSDEERKKMLKTEDIQEQEEERSSIDDENIGDKTLMEINRSARAVEIIGQILRNRQGSLTKNQLYDLTRSAYSSGLKFLGFYLNLTKDEELITFIRQLIQKDDSLSDDEVAKRVRGVFMMLCYGISYGVIKKISNSIGSKQLMPIFESITKDHPEHPIIQLIQISIHLEFSKEIPQAEVLSLYRSLEKNTIARRLLQELVLQHLYLHDVSFQEQQWVSSTLGIPMKVQRSLQLENLKAGHS